MIQNYFVGVWRLVSSEVRDTQGRSSKLYHADSSGYLIYTDNGYVSVHVNVINPPDMAKIFEVFMELSLEQKAAMAKLDRETYFSYCGKYEIQTDKVIHYVELSSNPIVSGIQERFFKFVGDSLELSAPWSLEKSVELINCLIWERVL